MLLICLLTFCGSAIAARLSSIFNQERELLLVIAALGLILSLILAPGAIKLVFLGLVILGQQLEII